MSSLSDLRVLVTGGAGFMGSEVVKQLCELNANVTVFDNFSSGKSEFLEDLDVEITRGDVCNKESVIDALKDQERVIHMAALPFIPDSYVNPEAFFETNAAGTMNVLWEAIQSESVEEFIHISSSEVYGSAKYVPMDENHPTLPHSTYAVSKLAGDRAVFTIHKEQDFPTVVLRPFNSYGPRITQPYIVPEVITQLLNGNQLNLGNTETSRDFTYVSDTARGIILALQKQKAIGETINIGSGQDIKIGDLARLIARLMNKKAQIKQDESRFRPFDVERLLCDNSKAKELLDWEPQISLEDGLKKTIEWIKANPTRFKEPFKGPWPKLRK